ncbi:MutS-related protein [Pedobacter steynii]
MANDIDFNADKNVCFITGSKYGRKSTLLKSIAIAIYLAHLGFPVPAKSMETSVFDGLITTINLSDNLNQGYSHFYNEVLRVKEVAQKVTASKNMVVIFDELFRGTNVKDAYDASLSIIKAFSKIRKSFFIISTHIVEVAKELNENNNINFRFLETKIIEGKPVFTHQLKAGITDERMGMWIIENEGIMEILNGNNVL